MKTPTAREFYDAHDSDDAVVMMIDFAKMHVEAALKEASKKAKLNLFTKGDYKGAKWILLKDGDSYNPMERSIMSKIDKKSILKSYLLENIK